MAEMLTMGEVTIFFGGTIKELSQPGQDLRQIEKPFQTSPFNPSKSHTDDKKCYHIK